MKITRSDNTDSEILKDFAEQLKKNFEKQSVQSYDEVKERQQAEQEQLKNILSGYKPKYKTVSEAVEDMKRRAGLNDYLKQIAAKTNDNNNKLAQQQQNQGQPKLFSIDENVKSSIDSLIERRRGNIDIIAVIHECVEKDKIDSNLIDNDLKNYIATKILEVKKRNPSEDLKTDIRTKEDTSLEGKDPSNDDFFYNMTGKH